LTLRFFFPLVYITWIIDLPINRNF